MDDDVHERCESPDDTTALMQRYVAKEVIHRLAPIQSLYEQEIVGADYFMYAQDYAPEWIPQLRVGKAHPFLGGEKVDVLLATESTPIHLEVYTRWEEGRWKIYRVRDADRGYEQPIYDAGAITRLRPGQRKSRRNIRSIKKGNRHRSLVRTGEVKAPLASGAYSVAENSKPKITRHYLKYEVLSVSLTLDFSFEQRIISMKKQTDKQKSPQRDIVYA